MILEQLDRTWPRDRAVTVRFPDGREQTLGAGTRAATITLHRTRALRRVALRGEMGGGEAYVDGDWDADDLVAVAGAFLAATGARTSWLHRLALLPDRILHRLRGHTTSHYDLGDDFFAGFLDDEMVYSCAIWGAGDDLARAQQRKLERVLDLAEVGPGDKVLELGCGWGALAAAAQRRGAKVTAFTASSAHAAAAKRRGIDAIHADFREARGTFDRVLSIEMLEQVGLARLPDFARTVARRLRTGGRAVVQTITMPDARARAYRKSVDWMQTYVFPGTEIPSPGAMDRAWRSAGLRAESTHEIGPDYAPTLRAWRERFETAPPDDVRFARTWRLYLAFSEAAFASRTLGDAQIVLSR
jgi:cyclopropane-fatty-acyl-phospholipid synthase